LNIAVRADSNRLIVATQHSAKPETGIFPGNDLTDQCRIRCDPIAALFRKLRFMTIIDIDGHGLSSLGFHLDRIPANKPIKNPLRKRRGPGKLAAATLTDRRRESPWKNYRRVLPRPHPC